MSDEEKYESPLPLSFPIEGKECIGAQGATPPQPPEPAGAADSSTAAALCAPISPELKVLSPETGNPNSALRTQNSLLCLTEEELARVNEMADELRLVQAVQTVQAVQAGAARLGLSVATVRRKLRALEKYGLAGLVRKSRADRGRARVADEKILARIKAQFLKPYRPPAAEVYRAIEKDFEMSGVEPPSYSFVVRVCRSIDPDLVARFRVGEREYDDKFAYITLRKNRRCRSSGLTPIITLATTTSFFPTVRLAGRGSARRRIFAPTWCWASMSRARKAPATPDLSRSAW